MVKMESYKKLQEQFDNNVAELQKECSHTQTTWMEKHWGIGRYSGYDVLVCENCNAILEEKPNKEEREQAEKEVLKQLHGCTIQ